MQPSAASIAVAQAHAAELGLAISYRVGSGEAPPFADASFDIACCCVVLERLHDVSQVIAAIARVLRSGGICFYATPSRTLLSKLTPDQDAARMAVEAQRGARSPRLADISSAT